jgi:hypothetical protein
VFIPVANEIRNYLFNIEAYSDAMSLGIVRMFGDRDSSLDYQILLIERSESLLLVGLTQYSLLRKADAHSVFDSKLSQSKKWCIEAIFPDPRPRESGYQDGRRSAEILERNWLEGADESTELQLTEALHKFAHLQKEYGDRVRIYLHTTISYAHICLSNDELVYAPYLYNSGWDTPVFVTKGSGARLHRDIKRQITRFKNEHCEQVTFEQLRDFLGNHGPQRNPTL